MRLGLSVTTNHADLTGPEAMATVLARARAATTADLDHFTVGDHHATGPNNYLQNVPTLARALADWPTAGETARPAGALFLLPLWNPILMAEQIGTLATMTDAPLIVQTGIGHGRRDFAAMGASLATRGDVTDEAITLVKALLAGETVSHERFGITGDGFTGASIAPTPPRPVEWWIGSGTGDRPLDRAAREGDAWYVTPAITADDLAPVIDRYRQRCAHHGTTPRVCVRRDVLVTDDGPTAHRIATDLISAGYRGMDERTLVIGSVEEVADRLGPLADIGVDDIVARTMTVEPALAVRSVELLGQVRSLL